MALKKDKQKVVGEFFDEARIREFLTYEAPEVVNNDFHLLERAYRGMLAENFVTFLQLFQSGGGDINAKNTEGKTLLDLVQQHSAFQGFTDALKTAGAS
jgi:hypothetical protein